MVTETCQIMINGLSVQIVRKAIKNLHLGVYPPEGRVRMAVPLAVSDEAVRLVVIGKLPWIRRQQAKFEKQPRQSQREMVRGESHYYLGRRYRLHLIQGAKTSKVRIRSSSIIELHLSHDATAEERGRVLQRWYRRKLRALSMPLLQKWQNKIGVQIEGYGIKRMKTKWGSCNPESKRIWLNFELVKKMVECLEYIIVHELIHIIEPSHNDRFIALMDHYHPCWRQHRTKLNAAPLAHENWSY